MAQVPKHRQLPDKEGKLFRELLTQYELRQYKKGLKAADTILKKHPNHGETLALKALTVHSTLPFPMTAAALPKQVEAEEMARVAVKKDITSHITWHVLGILAKSRKDWSEASRAFAMARKQDPDNIPLIRDSIALFLHTRQFGLAISVRHHYLLIRPNIRSSWLGLMIAHYLAGEIEEAIMVHDGLVSCIKSDGATRQERAQTLVFVVKMCMEAKDYEDALDRLERGLRNDVLSPRGEVSQLRAEILAALGRTAEAEDGYRLLLEQNSDRIEYYRSFLRIQGLDITKALETESRSKVLHTLTNLSETYTRSATGRRLALDIAEGDEFRDLVRSYLITGLERGVPSLYVDLKGVYSSPTKMSIVGEVMEDIVLQLETFGSIEDDGTAPPTVLLWAYYYLALHLSHPSNLSPSPSRSLDLLNTALQHTPTLPELYMAKAMVLKRVGDPFESAQAMEEARLLDGQDRFLNCKAAKYWLRAGEVKRAEDIVGLFTKKDISPVLDLTDLQCLWFLLEEGDAHRRDGNIALALKRYQALINVFQDYEDDQYDFHTYCMRRMTFSGYIALMRYEDQLRSHSAYFRGAIAAIEIYLAIHDDPGLTEEKFSPEEEAERKKAAKKAQKADVKARKAAVATGESKKDDLVPDEDPLGQKLLKTETPLDDAFKIFAPLEHLAAQRIETWTIAYEIDIRRKRYTGCLKCLLKAAAIDPEDPTLHRQILNYRRNINAASDLPEPTRATIDALFPQLFPSSSNPEEFNISFLSRQSASPSHILGAAEGMLEIKRTSHPLPSNTPEEVQRILLRLTDDSVPPSVSTMLKAVKVLQSAGASEDLLASFRKRCRDRAPLAWVLATDGEKADRRAKAELAPNGLSHGKADV